MYQGSLVALVTPMHPDGALDDEALARLVEFHIAAGTDAIVAVGTTGESATLDMDEHCHVLRRVVQLTRQRIPVIAGTGANATQEAVELTQCAKQAGADACLLVTPYYNKPTQHGLFLHFKAIAEAVDIPQILYNVPSRTACDLLPDTVARLAQLPTIIGIKEALADMGRIRALAACGGPGFTVYSGDDETALEALRGGAKGVVSVTANVAPRAMHALCAAALAGNFIEAETINMRLADLHRDLFLESNPIPVKWALQRMGMIGAGIRLPLTPLSPSHHARVQDALHSAQVL